MMLYLIFKAGENQYALETARVLRVVPYVKLRPILSAPAYAAGLMNFRGAAIIVIDLSMLINHMPCERFLSTRIIIMEYSGHNGKNIRLGLMAEGVTSLLKKDPSDFTENVVNPTGSNHLGKMFRDGARFIQIIKTDEIVPAELENMLTIPA